MVPENELDMDTVNFEIRPEWRWDPGLCYQGHLDMPTFKDSEWFVYLRSGNYEIFSYEAWLLICSETFKVS